jgi:HTH-type transcriptional regulator / antitoxin HigA
MIDDAPFTPDWISPPGDTIATILEERSLSPEKFAQSIGQTWDEVKELLNGRAALTGKIARKIAVVLGSSPTFWTRRESRYRQDFARLQREASRPASLGWLDEIPAIELMKWEWVKPVSEPAAKVAACLQYFGVSSVEAWREAYKDVLHVIALRTSPTFESQLGAVAAWLRQGEIAASSIKCEPWDPERFRQELASIRGLTRQPDPAVFLPDLVQRCAACGVAVVVVRAPKNCRASGASRFLSPNRPILLLSFRYLSDDHFWFTFFHEAAHLLLHSDKYLFLEGDYKLSSTQEEEANAFAAATLIPPEFQAEMLQLTANKIAVMRFARKVGVSRGIVVGQLQHRRIIERNQLNSLKQRYKWSEE